MKKIKAKFIGAHGSLGFEHGKTYELELKGMTVHYKKPYSKVKCSYSSVQSFTDNWTNIKNV